MLQSQQLDKGNLAGLSQILPGAAQAGRLGEPWMWWALPAWCCWHRGTGTKPSVRNPGSSLACRSITCPARLRHLSVASLTLLGRRRQQGKDKNTSPHLQDGSWQGAVTLVSTSPCVDLSVETGACRGAWGFSMDFSHYKQAFSSSPVKTCLHEQSQP